MKEGNMKKYLLAGAVALAIVAPHNSFSNVGTACFQCMKNHRKSPKMLIFDGFQRFLLIFGDYARFCLNFG